MHGEKAGSRGEGRRKWPRKREIAGDGLGSARNLGSVSLKDMKSTGREQIPWKVRRGKRGKEAGVRPGEGVEPGREPAVERMKGEKRNWKSARDIILMLLPLRQTSSLDWPIRSLRHRPRPSSSLSSSLPSLEITTDATVLYAPPCLEVNPPNIAPHLTSNPPSHSIIIIIIIITTPIISKNNNLPPSLPPLPIPKNLFHALSLSNPDQTWISSQILSNSPLPPLQRNHALTPVPQSAEIRPFLFLVSPSRKVVALLVVHPAHPPLHQAALVMAALPHKPNPSSRRSNQSPLLPTSTNGVSLRPP